MKIETFLQTSPVIAAVQFENLALAAKSRAGAVLLMYAKLEELLSADFQTCNRLKPIFIHLDLLKGLSSDSEALHFLHHHVRPAGIVSTKGPAVRAAKKEGLQVIQRVFLIDTRSFEQSVESVRENKPDAVEIMPGIAPSIVSVLKARITQPVILGGLIATEHQLRKALLNGADGVSLSHAALWNLPLQKASSSV